MWVDTTRWVSSGSGETKVLNCSVFHEVNMILFPLNSSLYLNCERPNPTLSGTGSPHFLVSTHAPCNHGRRNRS